MRYIVLGCLAIGMMALFDWVSMRGYARIKVLFFMLAVLCFGLGLNGVLASPRELQFPPWVSVLGWVGIVVYSLLLIYSILIEIPLKITYLQSGAVQPLVSTGTYALVRHPGLLWFAGFAVSLFAIHPSRNIAIAFVIWMMADFLLIVLEDRYFFPRAIQGYPEYKLTTPFLMPSWASLRKFRETVLPSREINGHSPFQKTLSHPRDGD